MNVWTDRWMDGWMLFLMCNSGRSEKLWLAFLVQGQTNCCQNQRPFPDFRIVYFFLFLFSQYLCVRRMRSIIIIIIIVVVIIKKKPGSGLLQWIHSIPPIFPRAVMKVGFSWSCNNWTEAAVERVIWLSLLAHDQLFYNRGNVLKSWQTADCCKLFSNWLQIGGLVVFTRLLFYFDVCVCSCVCLICSYRFLFIFFSFFFILVRESEKLWTIWRLRNWRGIMTTSTSTTCWSSCPPKSWKCSPKKSTPT